MLSVSKTSQVTNTRRKSDQRILKPVALRWVGQPFPETQYDVKVLGSRRTCF